jgi:hypothetical protein
MKEFYKYILFLWGLLIVLAAVLLSILNLYKVITKNKLIESKYEIPISFVQSSYYIYYVLIVCSSILNIKFLINNLIVLLTAIFFLILTPFSLTIIDYFTNLTYDQESALIGVNLISIFITTVFSISFLNLQRR